MQILSKNVYIYKLDDTVNNYNNTSHRTIIKKPVDVKSSTYIDFGIRNNDNGDNNKKLRPKRDVLG